MGLRESVHGEWAGDEDLGTGDLKSLYVEYKRRCGHVRSLGTHKSFTHLDAKLTEDLSFLEKNDDVAKQN